MMTGAVFLGGALAVMPAFLVLGIPLANGIPAIALGLISATLVFILPAPQIGSVWNHLLLIASWGVPVLAYYGSLPHAAQVASGFTFTGALVAFRLTDRREIALHMATVIGLLLIPIAFGATDRATIVAVLILVPAVLSLAAIVIVVLEAAEEQGEDLEHLIRRDPLTGVGNRRLLSERLAYELARHERSGLPFALIALDLNGFKSVNDTLGHDAGDELLVAVAGTLKDNVRAQDTIVRQGGDEFCVLLPETGTQDAEHIGASLRDALALIVAGTGPLTTGLGIAEYARDGRDIDTILRLADARLREDKQRKAPFPTASPRAGAV